MALWLDRLLHRYEAQDFVLQQKARVLFGICIAMLSLIPLLALYVIFVSDNVPAVWMPAIACFIIIAVAIGLLIRGHYALSSHMTLIICLAAVWIVMFRDPGGPVMRLDTFVLVLAILTMTPLIIIERKSLIIYYFLANGLLLVLFLRVNWHELGIPQIEAVDYLIDSLFALTFMCVTSYYVFAINKRSLDIAKRDIIERKQAEHQTAMAKAFLESSLASIPDGVLLMDENAQFSYANPALLQWVGGKESDFSGKSIGEMLDTHIEGRFRRYIKYGIVSRIRNGETIIGAEIGLKDSRGQYKPVSVTASAITDAEDTIIGGIAILVDLTERKQLEDRLRQSQKIEAIGTLAGGIAHDFNNILSAIMGNTELVLMKHPEGGKFDKKLESIYLACQRAKDLIGQILAFSRRSNVEPKPVAMRGIVKESLKLLGASLPSSIEIREDIADESIQVMADPTQIHQILMNLCTNAHHAMIQGGGVLEVGLCVVDIKADETYKDAPVGPGSWVQLSISDTGEGIAPDILDRIFDPYFTTKGKAMGTGLGLSVVHGIVKSYGGAVDVESFPGKGSVFRIYLPLLENFAEFEIQPPPPMHLGQGQRLLIVDDEQMIIDYTTEALTHLGYSVTSTTSPKEALEMFRSDPNGFELILTDMTMPGCTGEELAEKILHIRPEMPVILCTGYSERITRREAEKIGIRAFLMKPINLHEMSATIRHLINPSSSGTASRPRP